MKIVSFGDVHMATRNLARMGDILRDTDLIIISGDLTNFGGVDDARKVLDDVRAACSRVLAMPGNLDQPEVFPFLEKEGIALHGHGLVVDGLAIFGCGGSTVTPFRTPSEFTEEEVYAALQKGYDEVAGRNPALMVCHTPPFDTKCDRIASGKAVGSIAARKFIEEHQPAACISGHIHESAGVDTIGVTKVFNAGPFKGGGYIVVEFDGKALDARLEFL
ncbi:MAG TPA: metallophosphoesterase [Candidatus Binataceae bacterium]|nr:metallophosphoesterase [Candidatus Binataceae bacterium]